MLNKLNFLNGKTCGALKANIADAATDAHSALFAVHLHCIPS